MATFEREVEVEVDLDEFDEDEMVSYLEGKGYTVEYDGEPEEQEQSEPSRKRLPSHYSIKRCFDNRELREHLLNLAGLGSYVSNDELVNRIKELL